MQQLGNNSKHEDPKLSQSIGCIVVNEITTVIIKKILLLRYGSNAMQ